MIKLGGEEYKDKIKTIAIAVRSTVTKSAIGKRFVAKSARKGVAAESNVERGITGFAMGESIVAKSARGEECLETIMGRRSDKSAAVGRSEYGVKINSAVGYWTIEGEAAMGCNSTLGYSTIEGEAAMGYTSYAVGDGPAAGIYRVRSGLTNTIYTVGNGPAETIDSTGSGPTDVINTVESGSTVNKGICTLHAFKSVTTKDKYYEKDTQGIEQYENARVVDENNKGGNVDRGKAMKDSLCNVESGFTDRQREDLIDTSTDTVGNGFTDTAYTVGNGSAVGGIYTVGVGLTDTSIDEKAAEVKYIEEYAEGDSVKTNNEEGGHALNSLPTRMPGWRCTT